MKKCFIALIGGTVVVIGLVMLVLPGPGVLVIAGGLTILATEFMWARRAMRQAKGAVAKVRRLSGPRERLDGRNSSRGDANAASRTLPPRHSEPAC